MVEKAIVHVKEARASVKHAKFNAGYGEPLLLSPASKLSEEDRENILRTFDPLRENLYDVVFTSNDAASNLEMLCMSPRDAHIR